MSKWSDKTFNFLTDFVSILIILVLLVFAAWWAIQKPVFWLRGIDVVVHGNQEAITAPVVAEKLKGKISGTFYGRYFEDPRYFERDSLGKGCIRKERVAESAEDLLVSS